MVLDFSQAGERPAQVWALPPQALASPAGTEAGHIDELLPQYEELPPVGAEATALWRPDDLEANISMNPFIITILIELQLLDKWSTKLMVCFSDELFSNWVEFDMWEVLF
ncbi:hypothetical protein R3I93_004483 [Phoxinus phoxinus]|uniref:Uncharacterized protein n=1 Tax=Phoxinus phoxinus TaxID=58324 RepID=A0AAN9DFD5_9TELE